MKTLTTALATSAFLMTSGLALAQTPQPQTQPSPRPQTEQPRTGTPTTQQNTMNEMVLQGCIARDDASGTTARQGAPGQTGQTGSTAGAATSAAGSGGMFLLRNAKKQDASGSASSSQAASGAQSQTGSSAQATQSGTSAQGTQRSGTSSSGAAGMETYRLMATGSNVDLSKHIGHQVEVRGRVMESAGKQGMAGGQSRTGQAGQTGQTGQAGQAGQTGQAGQAGQANPYGASSGDQHKTMTVTSVRMISDTCAK